MSINKNLFKNYLTRFFTIVFLVVFSFFIGKSASADIPGFVTDIIGWVALRLVELFGVIFVWLVDILLDISQFNEFTTLSMVETGWGLARDVSNMFFIVVLLIIAFSTVLKISSYHYQKTLTKLLIMAILVNFSKLIAGFLIDFFQVIMLTFVNGFKDAAAGNLAAGFGIYEMLASANTGQVGDIGSDAAFALAAILAVLMIIIADMIVLIMIAVLLWRIAMLWVLVIISPLAYLSYAIMPKYWSQWWQMFFQHLTSGPIIAFFLWLALLTMQQNELKDKLVVAEDRGDATKSYTFVGSGVDNVVLMNYFVSIALLMGGLAIAQKVAAQSGGAVGNFAQKVQKIGTKAAMISTGAYFVKRGIDKVQKFNQMRENVKADRDTQHAATLMGLYGGLKKGTIGLAGRGIRKAYTKIEKTQERDKNRIDLDTAQNDLMDMEDKGWNDKSHANNDQYEAKNTEVANLEKDRKKLQMRKWAVRAGVATLGIGAFPVASLVGAGAAVATLGAGSAAAIAGAKKMSQSGQAEIDLSKNWKAREVSKHGDEIKKMTDDKIEVIIKDEAENHYRRLAALFEKVTRGKGRADEGNYYRDLVKRLGGNDKVINNQYDNLARQYLPGYTPASEKDTGYRDDESKRSVALADFEDRTKKQQMKYDVMDVDSWKRTLGSILKGLVDVKKDESGNVTGEIFDHTEITTAIRKASPDKKQVILESLEKIVKTDTDDKQKIRATEVLLANGGVDRVDWSDPKITNEKFAQMYQKNKRDIEGSLVDNPDAVSLGFMEKMIDSLNNKDVAAFYSNIKKSGRGDDKTVDTYLNEEAVKSVNNKAGTTGEEKSITLISNILKRSGDVKQIFAVDAKVQNKVLQEYSSSIKPDDFSRIKPTTLDDNQLNQLTDALLQKIDYATVESGINKGIQDDKTAEMKILADKIIQIAIVKPSKVSIAAEEKAVDIYEKAEKKPNSRLAQYID